MQGGGRSKAGEKRVKGTYRDTECHADSEEGSQRHGNRRKRRGVCDGDMRGRAVDMDVQRWAGSEAAAAAAHVAPQQSVHSLARLPVV